MAALANGTNTGNANINANANATPDSTASSNASSRLASLVRTSRNNHRNTTNNTTNTNRNFAAVQFTENRHRIRLCLDLPGVLPQDLSVELQQGVLLIQGTRLLRRFSSASSLAGTTSRQDPSSSSSSSSISYYYRQQHKFCRRFAMDTDVVDATRMQANLDPRTGLLQIVAPKYMDRPQALRIAVTNYVLHNNNDHDEYTGDEQQVEDTRLSAMPEVHEEEEEEEMTEEVLAAADRAAEPSLSKTRSAQSIASTAAAVAAAAGVKEASKANRDMDNANSPSSQKQQHATVRNVAEEVTSTGSQQQQPAASASPSSQQLSQLVVPLRHVVSMGSAADALEAAQAMVSVRRRLSSSAGNKFHSSSKKSHLMIRRSMSHPNKVNTIV